MTTTEKHGVAAPSPQKAIKATVTVTEPSSPYSIDSSNPATPTPHIQPAPPEPCHTPPPRLDFADISNKVYSLAQKNSQLGEQTKVAIEVIEKAIQTYGLGSISISFNGGKDCTVLLHIYAAVLWKFCVEHPQNGHVQNGLNSSLHPPSSARSNIHSPANLSTSSHHDGSWEWFPTIPAIYITYPNPFPEVELFVQKCCYLYGLHLERISGDMKRALQHYLDTYRATFYPNISDQAQEIKAILVGTRRNDPRAGNLQHFDPTDPGWPEFMRVHPIIDWSYRDIWDFLLQLNVEYCVVYDKGYTSLGSSNNTHQNPDLRNPALEGGFDPAYKLRDETHERSGRVSKPKGPEGSN
ncbi:hypothetical protein BZG36_01614 [Bifiguratus adelaidae]|uniref:FAD synthase n=1 Tax=Bifiguratus adelaidae TaxID=1938954 RepID=A0A261Y483_9FUNG|nr:hypothetical protein BZG36_01614 [Bifiguratus adelaidae]